MAEKVVSMLELRNELVKIIEDFPLSYHQYAKMIGISQHTLLAFIHAKKYPARFTLWKIERFIKKRSNVID